MRHFYDPEYDISNISPDTVRGDPEKHDNYGNTALHLASAKGHLNCATLLINFGVNPWELDIDQHSAK